MSEKIYNITKEAASQLVGISTRTIDRYIASGKLSSRKVGNKVMLAQQEVVQLKSDRDTLPKDGQIDLVSPEAAERQSTSAAYVNPEIIGAILDEKLTKFSGLLEDKERLIEDKNKIIYLLQNKVGELETRIKSMIALPEYTTEKQKMIEQKQQLEYAIQTLQKDVKRFKTENYVYIGIFVVLIILGLALFTYTQ